MTVTTEFDGYLQYTTLEGKKILINGQERYKIPLPKVPKNLDNLDNAIIEGCQKYNLDYVSTENIRKCSVSIKEKHYLRTQPDRPQEGDKEERKEVFIQKYSNGRLAEAVLIGGRPCFLIGDKEGNIETKDSIELETTLQKPLEQNMYMNKPYVYSSEEELQAFIERAKGETLDTHYRKIKAICRKYVAADDAHLSILAADIIYTYFQDRIGLCHYLFFVGNNSSGKSNNLRVINELGYRNMKSTDITPANIYRFLGNDEEAQGTLCEDEADSIDLSPEKMRIYKEGYVTGSKVMRSESTTYGIRQQAFWTFCFKAFAAERLPDSVRARGFNQRCIEINCYYGIPDYDITEIVNPAGVQEYEDLLSELTDARKTLLLYRLLHYHQQVPTVKLNVQGRENQLFSPLIRVFHGTETEQELLPVISKLVSQKREANANSWHAYLYKIIKDTIAAQEKTELESSLIWDQVTANLTGTFKTNRSGDRLPSFESEEYGTISQKIVIETYMQIFGARQSPNRREKRKLVFDKETVVKLGRIYELDVDVQVVTDVSDVTDNVSGIQRFLNDEGRVIIEPPLPNASQESHPSPEEAHN